MNKRERRSDERLVRPVNPLPLGFVNWLSTRRLGTRNEGVDMGKIRRWFSARNGAGHVTGHAKVDSGADRTVLPFSLACRLGLGAMPNTPTAEAKLAGGSSRLFGHFIPATLEMRRDGGKGRLEGHLDKVFVPTHEPIPGHEEEQDPPLRPLAREPAPLIGHDFLQESKASLRFRKGRGELSGSMSLSLTFRKLTARERRHYRDIAPARSCPTPRSQKRKRR